MFFVGCAHPLHGFRSSELNRLTVSEACRGLGDRADRPVVERFEDRRSALPYDLEHARELEEMSGPGRYGEEPADAGRGLDGSEPHSAPMSLGRATLVAVHHNLDAKVARLLPVIRQTQVEEEEAAFDPAVFAETSFSEVDRPQQASALNGVPVGSDQQVQDNAALEAGIRKRLETGTEVSLSSAARHINDKSPRLEYTPDPAWTSDAGLSVRQPLLRGLGRDVNRARIELAETTQERDAIETRLRVSNVLLETHKAYWELAFHHYRTAVQSSLLEITRQTLEELNARRGVDVKPVQIAQAESFVRQRRSELIQSRVELRNASDALKVLTNDANLPLAGEAVIFPTDRPDLPAIDATLRDSLQTAVRRRPELQQVMLDIRQTLIQQRVAENSELPQLDLIGELRAIGLDGKAGRSYERLSTDDHWEYTVGLELEAPLGHRAATASAKRARLTRQAHSLRYRRVGQDVVLSVKRAIRKLQSTYELVGVTREGRLAAAENLRALVEREKDGEALTPEFLLDLKLATQQRLADAELREMRAMIDYNIAVAEYYHALGVMLERSGYAIDRPGKANEEEAS